MNRWVVCGLAGLVGVWSSASRGAAEMPEPVVTDRPDFTESAETVAGGRMQLESGYTYTQASGDRSQSLGELLLRVGLDPRTEIRIGLNSYTWERTPSGRLSGLEDADLGFKVRLTRGSARFDLRRPTLAVIGLTSLPTGGTAYRTGRMQPEVKLCSGWALSPKADLSMNVNLAYPVEDGGRYRQWVGSASYGYDLSSRLGSFLEIYGFTPGSRGGPNTAYLDTGLTYAMAYNRQLDVRVGHGLNGISHDFFLGAGFSRRY